MSDKTKELIEKSNEIVKDLADASKKVKNLGETLSMMENLNKTIQDSNRKCDQIKSELNNALSKYNDISKNAENVSKQNEDLIKTIKSCNQKVQDIYNSIAVNINSEIHKLLESHKDTLELQAKSFIDDSNKLIKELRDDYRKHNTESFNRMSECLNTVISRMDIFSSTVKAFNDSVSASILSIDKKLEKVYEISNDVKNNTSLIKQVDNNIGEIKQKTSSIYDVLQSIIEVNNKFEAEINTKIDNTNSSLAVILDTINNNEQGEKEYRNFIKKQLKKANIFRYIMTAGIGIVLILLIFILV